MFFSHTHTCRHPRRKQTPGGPDGCNVGTEQRNFLRKNFGRVMTFCSACHAFRRSCHSGSVLPDFSPSLQHPLSVPKTLWDARCRYRQYLHFASWLLCLVAYRNSFRQLVSLWHSLSGRCCPVVFVRRYSTDWKPQNRYTDLPVHAKT